MPTTWRHRPGRRCDIGSGGSLLAVDADVTGTPVRELAG
jgi:hypothetical protein